ncbi:MAG: HIRAN domain-containing protein [Lachnospiraceae bacterium]|nr:HIRAN domain-containing protein [Lachnospiraceae bacterium]
MKEMYFTIAGCSHYFGNDFMKKGMKVKLEKEPDNDYDKEAIIVNIKGMGKCGYVANSSYTVKGESMSAGRLYDKLGKKAKGKIVYVIPGGAICKITKNGLDDKIKITEAQEMVEEKLSKEEE